MSKIFKSHKKVTPTPMTRLEYNTYRGWEVPEDEDGTDEGYLVEYLDGGKPNHPDHKGYISWSPKRQFDEGYTEVSEEVPEYQQRVISELAELRVRKVKLDKFMQDEGFAVLPEADRRLLVDQSSAMQGYETVLAKRVEAF